MLPASVPPESKTVRWVSLVLTTPSPEGDKSARFARLTGGEHRGFAVKSGRGINWSSLPILGWFVVRVSLVVESSTPDSSEPQSTAPAIPEGLADPLASAQTPSQSPSTAPGETLSSESPATEHPTPDEFDDSEELTPELVEDEAIRGDFVLRWAVVLIAGLLALTRFTESMTLTHIASGQYLATHGIIPPALDPLAIPTADRRWDNLGWGFDLLLAAVYGVGGFALISLLKAGLVATTFGLLVHLARPDIRTWWHALCAALALLSCRHLLGPLPSLFTLLGTVFVVGWWLQPRLRSGPALGLVPLCVGLVVWSNLDPRAWIGPFLLLALWLGTLLDGLRQQPLSEAAPEPDSTTDPAQRGLSARSAGELARAFGAGCLVLALNPFGWRVWLAPYALYAREYPAFREYLQGATPAGPTLQYFPITEPAFWAELDISLLAVVTLALASLATLVLNRRQLRFADLFVVLASFALGALALRELPVFALVAAALAAVNGQAWYAANCRLTYRVDPRELLFSRGGRAVTVLAFTAIAFFGATGRLPGPISPVTGLGLDEQQEITLTGTAAAAKELPAPLTYNIRPPQGDQLIFSGVKPFIDGRIGLYGGRGRDNLIALHRKVRAALLRPNPQNPEAGDPSVWKTVLDKYGIQSVMPRLSGGVAQAPDHSHLVDLIASGQPWQLTYLGSAAAVFVRTDNPSPERSTYLETHRFDLERQVYQVGTPAPPAREQWATPPSFYDRYIWMPRRIVPGESIEALHYFRLHSEPSLPPEWQRLRHALAVRGLQLAQAGLARDPESPDAWAAVGTGERLMINWEGTIAPSNLGPEPANVRYYLAVAAFRQALVARPDLESAISSLMQLYQYASRPELALREAQTLAELLQTRQRSSRTMRDALREPLAELFSLRGQISRVVDAAREELKQFSADNPDPLAQVQRATQLGLFVTSVELLEQSRDKWVANLSMRALYAVLLLELGRIEEAGNELQQLQLPADQAGLTSYREPLVVTYLAQGDYDRALQMLRESVDTLERSTLTGLLQTLPPKGSSPQRRGWPLDGLSLSFAALGPGDSAVSDARMWAGAVALEAGKPADAVNFLRPVAYGFGRPDTRGLAGFYLQLLTGENAEAIPVLFEPDPAP
jgi:tetratricopeptide (TPR) repeat protein